MSDPRTTWQKTVALTLDTSAYASGDLLADTQEIAGAVLDDANGCVLQSLLVLDEDAQGVAFTVYLTDVDTSFGTENSAPNISDANLRNVQAAISVSANDYLTVSGAKIASLNDLGIRLLPASGGTSMYFAVVNGTGAPTFSANGLRFKFGFGRL